MGDTHGQFFDLIHLLKLTGYPSSEHMMLFNGDFVDRGSWSTEVVITLFALKWLYPERVFLSRGNHETSDMNKVYGFEGETKKKYSELTFRLFEEIFCALPIGHLVAATQPPQPRKDPRLPLKPIVGPNGSVRYFIVHGGLFSNDDVTLEDVRKIDRKKQKQPSGETIMGEALWCDPQDAPGRGPSKRGIGVGFGPDITARFCAANSINGVIRSHEVRPEGYSIEHSGKCITVFSAPNYCVRRSNGPCTDARRIRSATKQPSFVSTTPAVWPLRPSKRSRIQTSSPWSTPAVSRLRCSRGLQSCTTAPMQRRSVVFSSPPSSRKRSRRICRRPSSAHLLTSSESL